MVDGVPVHRLPARLAPGAGFAVTPGALRRVGHAIGSGAFDVVHAHASVVSPVAYAGAGAGARRAMPTVLTFHSMLYRSAFLLGASESLFGWSRQRVVLSAVSSVVAAQLARWLPDASVAVLPNGVDIRFWRATAHLSPRRARGDVVFVSAMRLSRKKRPARLLRAFAAAVRFTDGAPPLRLVIAGDGPERVALERQAAALGVAERVELRGQLTRDELRSLYADADAFVLPSERESFGIAALEARAAGLPVIAMLAGGARDFIRQGVDGLLARDEHDLARAIERLALDAPFRAYVTRQTGSTVGYDWSEVAEQHERIYAAAAELRAADPRPSQR
jgi:glycosyltransferase involved in cell wall biosynthesis